MFKKKCFLFGSIFKLHGFKGEVNIYNESNIDIDSIDIEDYVGKLVSVSFNDTEELNDVKL